MLSSNEYSGQNLIMSLDFHEPAIAIGNYYRIE
jgi:hypothetical protein